MTESAVNKASYDLNALPDRNERGAFTIFCDEIRQEASGKLIYLGVYADELIVEKFPALVPVFTIYTNAWTPADRPFEKLIFRILLDETVLSEEILDSKETSAVLNSAIEEGPVQRDPGLRHRIGRMARFSPFILEKPGILRVRIETDDGEMRTSALRIRSNGGVSAAE